jgi:hypothetical protein
MFMCCVNQSQYKLDINQKKSFIEPDEATADFENLTEAAKSIWWDRGIPGDNN